MDGNETEIEEVTIIIKGKSGKFLCMLFEEDDLLNIVYTSDQQRLETVMAETYQNYMKHEKEN